MPEVWHRRVFTGDFAIGAGHRTANQRRHMDSVSARLASNDGAIGAHACQQDLGLRENVVVGGRSCIIPAGVPNPMAVEDPGSTPNGSACSSSPPTTPDGCCVNTHPGADGRRFCEQSRPGEGRHPGRVRGAGRPLRGLPPRSELLIWRSVVPIRCVARQLDTASPGSSST